MADVFDVLDKDVDKKRGMGVILCRYDQKLFLKDNVVDLPIEYIKLFVKMIKSIINCYKKIKGISFIYLYTMW